MRQSTYKRIKFNRYTDEEIEYIFDELCDKYELNEVKCSIYENDKVKTDIYYVVPKVSDRAENFNFKIDGNIIKYYSKKDDFKKEFASIIEAILIEYSNRYWS